MNNLENQLLRHISNNIPFYKGFKNISNLEELPIISKNKILDNLSEFISESLGEEKEKLIYFLRNIPQNAKRVGNEIEYSKQVIIESTTGTSGIPFRCVKTMKERTILALEIWRQRWEIDKLVCPNNFFQFSHVSLSMESPNVYSCELQTILNVYNEIKVRKIRWIHSTPVILLNHIKILKQNNIFLDIDTLKYIEICGYFISDIECTNIEKFFGVKVLSQYGCIETWPFGLGDARTRCFSINERVIKLELIDENDFVIKEKNKVGRVVVSTLHNKIFPFVRYETGDYAKYTDDDLTGRHRINLIEGRDCHIIKGIEDKRYGNLIFKKILRKIDFRININDLAYIQILQTAENRLCVYMNTIVEKNKFYFLLKKYVHEMLNKSYEIELVFVDNKYIEEQQKSKPSIFLCKY